MDWSAKNISTDRIQDNAELGGYIATKHLIDNGHRKIGCITGPLNKLTCQERLSGFRRALKEANIKENPNWIIEADFEYASAAFATKEILKQTLRPSALFCFNDNMALAAISSFQLNGVNVPEDISIIGYDNIDFAAFSSPPLTSIHQPKFQLGVEAAQLLLERIHNKSIEKQVLELKPKLIQRNSVRSI